VADFGLFDPTLDLSNFKFPTLDLLKEYSTGGITINQEELEENKNRIVDTLRNYKIEIAQIKATVGPSVTLYEIVPEAGIRISKIKSLEDDIALSLSALEFVLLRLFQEKELLESKFLIKIRRWFL
jgi:S-DNA-T family DNA segregation ATPase FtsK/SpoIIIE